MATVVDYQQAIDYLSSYTDYEVVPRLAHNAINYDLRRVDELLSRMGNPHRRAKSVHIAGTNGKGSVAAMITAALTASGYTTGLYISPHLHTWRERIRVDGQLISEGELAALVTGLQPEAEAVNERATYGRLTTFELLTALAFVHFVQKGAQFQVLEVGMGGQFDATNVITPEVCIITSISLDHTEVLGDSLAKIAREKAGIIKPGCRVVTSPQSDDVDRVIQSVCDGHGARLVRLGPDVTVLDSRFDIGRQQFRVKGRLDTYELSIPLLGRHQLENAATAVAALEVLAEKGFAVTRDSIGRGLSQVDWPGRLQVVSQRPLIVVDGAHNPDGARRLKESLGQYFEFDRAVLIIGTSDDKDIAGVVSQLAPVFDSVIVARSRHPRALPVATIRAEFGRYGIEAQVAEDIPAALAKAVTLAGDQDIICVAGSLFVVAEAIEQAKKLYPEGNP
jgi:dihydrofolate synthase/folylpolyglutamate synthase